MWKPTDIAYDVCRCYVNDSTWVCKETRERVLGFIRGRALKSLAEAQGLFNPHKHGLREKQFLMQVEAFFKKNENFSELAHTKRKALSSFMEAECSCSLVNQRLDTFFLEPDLFDPDLQIYVSKMQKFISNVLRDFSRFRDSIPSRIKVTSGASSTDSRRSSLPFLKVRKDIPAPAGARKYLEPLARTFGYRPPNFKWTNVNRVEVVPKNWKTGRCIACEPIGALPLQLAFDEYAKSRMRHFGVDLSNQRLNQELAKEGSINDNLSTIDLSMASDTLSINTVALLLPYEWFEFLDDIRSKAYKLPDGNFGEYAKFSSMGNGATFALETLIFLSAVKAVGSKRYAVYGDDIIIETDKVEELIRLLSFIGFQVNIQKSFTHGPFRESCGKNWYAGVDITPRYIRGISKAKTSWCVLVNSLAHVATPDGKLAKLLLSLVKKKELALVPYSESMESGVWIDPTTAYAIKAIRTRKKSHPWELQYKAYCLKAASRTIADSRTLFLWHLAKAKRPWSTDMQTSEVPLLSHKYVRKWVGWFPPAEALPAHLYWWSDYITGGN